MWFEHWWSNHEFLMNGSNQRNVINVSNEMIDYIGLRDSLNFKVKGWVKGTIIDRSNSITQNYRYFTLFIKFFEPKAKNILETRVCLKSLTKS